MSTESEMRAILQELHEKFNMRVYGASSYIKRDMRDRIEAVLAAAPQAPSGQQAEPTDEELGRIAYKGYDDYWTEECPGKESEAWTASAKAVIAALASQPSERPAPAGQAVGDRELRAAMQRGADGVYDLLKDWHLINKDARANKRLWQIARNLEGIFGCTLRGDYGSIAASQASATEPVAFGRIRLANIATVLVQGRNELHLKFNNDADLRDAYQEITRREIPTGENT